MFLYLFAGYRLRMVIDRGRLLLRLNGFRLNFLPTSFLLMSCVRRRYKWSFRCCDPTMGPEYMMRIRSLRSDCYSK